MAVLIDTDLLVDLGRGVGARDVELRLGEEERAISVITVRELPHGVHRASGARRARRSAFVEHLLAGLRAIPITEPVARVHADVWAQLAARGDVIGAHDLWIAATGLAHGLAVATRNAGAAHREPRDQSFDHFRELVTAFVKPGPLSQAGEQTPELADRCAKEPIVAGMPMICWATAKVTTSRRSDSGDG
ncbi:MAG: PIN domain-containing protein [Solirubrobacteraceae bacterium]